MTQGFFSPDEYSFWHGWYERHFHEVMSLDDLHFVGETLFRNPKACSIYNLAPSEAYPRGIRLLGRTAIEYCIDLHARAIASHIVRYLAAQHLRGPYSVVDLFAGSGNLLFHIVDATGAVEGRGLENDPQVLALSQTNLTLVNERLRILKGDWNRALKGLRTATTPILVIDPPWGAGHTSEAGLDLRGTEPSVLEVVSTLTPQLRRTTVWVIKTFEETVPASIDAVSAHFTHWTYTPLNVTMPGTNTGVLMGVTRV